VQVPYDRSVRHDDYEEARRCRHVNAAARYHRISKSALIGNLLAGMSLAVALVSLGVML
jgi:hypothetical protein